MMMTTMVMDNDTGRWLWVTMDDDDNGNNDDGDDYVDWDDDDKKITN